MAEKKKKKPSHEVHLKIGADVYKGKGTSILSALKTMKEPKDIKSIGQLETVVDGKLSRFPIRLFPVKVKRLFANEWEQELLAKRLDTLR